MAITPEGRVKDAVKRWFKAHNVWYFMPMQNGMGVVGIPDFIACFDGRFIAVETKAPGKIRNVSANQARRIEEIKNAGGIAIVVDSVEMMEKKLNEVGIG